MSITGQQNINIGLPNESTGSDSLYTAFTKTQNNFTKLFSCASSFNNFLSGNGISINANPTTGTVTILNTGVTQLNAGTGITLSGSNGNITISSNGAGNGGGGTVTSIGVFPVSNARLTSSSLSPVVSNGNFYLDLAASGVTAGDYVNPTLTVDPYGRIIAASNNTVTGTVTSVGLNGGAGIQISGGPITSNGNISVTNTGVLRLNAGSGINLSSGNGNVTISTTSPGGTVTSVNANSSSLNITGGPIVTAGTLSIELPNSHTFTGNITASNFIGNLANGNSKITILSNGNIAMATNGSNAFFIDTEGRVGIGSAAATTTPGVRLANPMTGNSTVYGFNSVGSIQPDATTSVSYYHSFATTAANGGTPYTIGNIYHYHVGQGTFDADSTVTNQTGYVVSTVMFGATNNYGFRALNPGAANITSGKTYYAFHTNAAEATGGGDTYAVYTSGTAPSYFNGNVSVSKVLLLTGSEDLAASAAANLQLTASYFTTAAAETATLAAGTEGQVKTFMMKGNGGDMVITVTNAGWKTSGTGTMTFDTIGDSCTLQYVSGKWFCIGNNGVVFA